MGYYKQRVQKELDDFGSVVFDINQRLINLEKQVNGSTKEHPQSFIPPKGEMSKVHHLLEVNFEIKRGD